METFVITLSAKADSADKVAEFYTRQNATYEQADGFIGRQVLRAKTGTMLEAVKKIYSEEELAKHPEGHHEGEPSVHFVIIEQWESVDQRMAFSQNRDKSADRELFPHLLPEHTHEFYEDLTPKT